MDSQRAIKVLNGITVRNKRLKVIKNTQFSIYTIPFLDFHFFDSPYNNFEYLFRFHMRVLAVNQSRIPIYM